MERFAKIANGLPLTIFARRFVLGDVLVSLLLTLKIPCASVSIVDFERVNVCWFPTAIRSNLVKTYSKSTIKTRTVWKVFYRKDLLPQWFTLKSLHTSSNSVSCLLWTCYGDICRTLSTIYDVLTVAETCYMTLLLNSFAKKKRLYHIYWTGS